MGKKVLIDSKVFEFSKEGNDCLCITEKSTKMVKSIIAGSSFEGQVGKAVTDCF